MAKLNQKGRKAVTVSLKANVIDKYSEYCKQQGMILSRRLEILIEKDMIKNEL